MWPCNACSLHPRGWPPVLPEPATTPALLPAPAGMAPRQHPPGHPRALLPASAGMAPPRSATSGRIWSAPRTRGDGPRSRLRISRGVRCSPYPRGWFRPPGPRRPDPPLFPALAGTTGSWFVCGCGFLIWIPDAVSVFGGVGLSYAFLYGVWRGVRMGFWNRFDVVSCGLRIWYLTGGRHLFSGPGTRRLLFRCFFLV